MDVLRGSCSSFKGMLLTWLSIKTPQVTSGLIVVAYEFNDSPESHTVDVSGLEAKVRFAILFTGNWQAMYVSWVSEFIITIMPLKASAISRLFVFGMKVSSPGGKLRSITCSICHNEDCFPELPFDIKVTRLDHLEAMAIRFESGCITIRVGFCANGTNSEEVLSNLLSAKWIIRSPCWLSSRINIWSKLPGINMSEMLSAIDCSARTRRVFRSTRERLPELLFATTTWDCPWLLQAIRTGCRRCVDEASSSLFPLNRGSPQHTTIHVKRITVRIFMLLRHSTGSESLRSNGIGSDKTGFRIDCMVPLHLLCS